MSPDDAVAKLVEILEAHADFTNITIHVDLKLAGFSETEANRVFNFTQIAWGRVFLDDLGLTYSPEYYCFNQDGEKIESGMIDNEPHFVAATAVARREPKPTSFAKFAVMSSVVQTVNQAMHAGSKPENLEFGPAAIFLEAATDEGLAKAQRILNESLGGIRKPWWKFW